MSKYTGADIENALVDILVQHHKSAYTYTTYTAPMSVFASTDKGISLYELTITYFPPLKNVALSRG
jgi:hypothetical protein